MDGVTSLPSGHPLGVVRPLQWLPTEGFCSLPRRCERSLSCSEHWSCTLRDFIVLNDRAWDWRASQGVLTPLTEPDEDLSILLAGSGQPRSPSDLPTSIGACCGGQAHDFSRGWLTLLRVAGRGRILRFVIDLSDRPRRISTRRRRGSSSSRPEASSAHCTTSPRRSGQRLSPPPAASRRSGWRST